MVRAQIMLQFYICFIYFTTYHGCTFAKKPNIVLILTDDQDVLLGGMTPLTKTKKLIRNEGADFRNMFVTSPLCCPSRASILVGRYVHNHGVVNNSISGGCSSLNWQRYLETKTFVTYLQNSGYTTFYAGKYLNEYGLKKCGGVAHIPPGWDHWIGLVGNSCYYNYSLSINGTEELHGNHSQDYLTDLLFNRAEEFLNAVEKKPFFMMISPPSPHSPFTPAHQYLKAFQNKFAPRTPNFGFRTITAKHWLLRQVPPYLSKDVIRSIDDVFKNRWRTLLSVDDGIEKLYNSLLEKSVLQDTYIFFSSDNGFHMGQFALPWDKRQPYEFDIRVPLYARGPKIEAGSTIEYPVLNIDLAPTFLALAGIKLPDGMDGAPFTSFFNLTHDQLDLSRTFLIEHQGEAERTIVGCPQYRPGEVHTCEIDCICEDSRNNTYVCLRKLSRQDNLIICYFQDNEEFVEIYNITSDPYQMQNLYGKTEKYKNHVQWLKSFKVYGSADTR